MLSKKSWSARYCGGTEAGKYNAPGLPNIRGGVATGAGMKVEYNEPASALWGGDNAPSEGIVPSSSPGNIYFDASRSNAIYGASNTVIPASVETPVALYLGRETKV